MKKLFISALIVCVSFAVKGQEAEPATDPDETQEETQNQENVEPAFERVGEDNNENEEQISDDRDVDFEDDDEDVKYYQAVTYRGRRNRDKRNDIKTLTGGMSHSGGFGALTFRSTEYRGENMVMVGARGGWIINRTLAIGLEGHGIIPTTKYADLNPTVGGEAKVVGGYGGMFLEPIFFSNEVVHITFPVSAGAGWMGYEEHFEDGRPESDELISDDVYWYAEPGVALEVNIARNFRLGFGVSKRFTQDLKLFNTAEDDFNTTNYFLTLKIGSF